MPSGQVCTYLQALPLPLAATFVAPAAAVPAAAAPAAVVVHCCCCSGPCRCSYSQSLEQSLQELNLPVGKPTAHQGGLTKLHLAKINMSHNKAGSKTPPHRFQPLSCAILEIDWTIWNKLLNLHATCRKQAF